MIRAVEKLLAGQPLTAAEFTALIRERTPELAKQLAERAVQIRREVYGDQVYVRGLIEFTNYCKNDCLYCGLRRSNRGLQRYRLQPEEILSCCREGYELGFRSFVLQGGEDGWYTPEKIGDLVASIKAAFPNCAVTLSVGEQPRQVYEHWFHAGAGRYLLRHETADRAHYSQLHPENMSFDRRMKCLQDLKEIGYQVGCGFMVGSPGQGPEELAKDLQFLQEFGPHMVGIGPFIPQKDTPLGGMTAGTLELTTYLLSIIRVLLPRVLLPATTALGTIDPLGREKGILAGANVCMPNLSPVAVREKYALYDNKICTGDEAAQCVQCLRRRIESVGCSMPVSRGDHVLFRQERS